jgi:integrase
MNLSPFLSAALLQIPSIRTKYFRENPSSTPVAAMAKLGEQPLQKIRPIDIQKLYAELTSLAPRTRHHVVTVLKACLQAAVDIGKVLAVNPAAAIKKPTATDTDIGQALEHEELLKLVEGFRRSTLFELVFVMAFTGMRRGEALALRWSNINAEKKELTIDRALEYTKKHGLQFKPPKSERGHRTIKLDDTLVLLFQRMRERYLRVVTGTPDGSNVDLSLVRLPDDWLVFHAPDGDFSAPRYPDSVTKQFVKRAAKILGFAIRLHDLRVTHGTWLLDEGTPVHVVAKRMGHDPSVLLRIYAKRTKRSDKDAAEKISQLTKGLSIGPS